MEKRESTIDVLRRISKQPPKEPSKKYSAYDVDKIFDDGDNSFQQFEEKKQPAASVRVMELQRLEQLIARMYELERRMQKGDNYFNLYYEMQKLNSSFLDILKEIENKKIILDEQTQRKVSRIRENLNKRAMK